MSTSTPLLMTKLYVPPTRAKLISRPRLIQRLAEGLARPLTLISAPAGFGKTTLISEWRTSEAGHDFPLAWLSLDVEDNDPTRFLTYFIAALQTLRTTIGESALALLQSTPPSPPHSILTSLINDLAGMPAPFAAVLDDYHFIVAPPIDEALAFLLDHLPSQMHIIMTTRADPPLSLARLRARDQLAEIRAADLRFTPGEAAAFFNHVMRLNLSADDSAALTQHTEGWIAGLQLAALSLQSSADVSGFIAAFTGSQRYIVDFLIEEVLERQSESTQSFLLLTSILERMTGPLCDALTGRADGQLDAAKTGTSKSLRRRARSGTALVSLSSALRRCATQPVAADSPRSSFGSPSARRRMARAKWNCARSD